MWVSRFADDIKLEVSKKDDLLSKKKTITDSIKKGEQFFLKEESLNPPSDKRMSEGARRMIVLLMEQEDIDRQLMDIDIIIISKLEMYLGDFIGKMVLPEKLNDAGDMIPRSEIFLVPFKTGNPEIKEVTPDDIWFLKLAKQAFSANNVEILQKPSVE